MEITEKDVGRKVVTRGGEEGQITEYVKCTKFPVKVCLEQSGFYAAYTPDGAFLPFDSPHINDLVGFVDEKQGGEELDYEPFDLERALAGEPVVLKDGKKAYVRYCEGDIQTLYPLMGYVEWKGYNFPLTWSKCGKQDVDHHGGSDIVGMYPQYRIIHGVKVPVFPDWRPKKGEEYYAVEILSPHFYRTLMWGGEWLDLLLQKRGLVYPATDAGNQAAILHAKAMLGITEDNDAIN